MKKEKIIHRPEMRLDFFEEGIKECEESKKLKNVISFLYSDSVHIDEGLKREIERCERINWKEFKGIYSEILKDRKRDIILSFECPEEYKEDVIKIMFNGNTLYAYEKLA
ncbi:MAG: hypothetical protein D6831_03710 [Aquificota bacterium]|nr:MAG: hypothetical protein D6831_03710 [Aquificota bacterium]